MADDRWPWRFYQEAAPMVFGSFTEALEISYGAVSAKRYAKLAAA